MAHTASLVSLVSTVSGRFKKELGRGSTSGGHITNFELSNFLQISMTLTTKSCSIGRWHSTGQCSVYLRCLWFQQLPALDFKIFRQALKHGNNCWNTKITFTETQLVVKILINIKMLFIIFNASVNQTCVAHRGSCFPTRCLTPDVLLVNLILRGKYLKKTSKYL